MKEITAKPGSHLLDCCIEACREAGRSVETVKMTFNGHSIEVEPGMSVRGIRDRWRAASAGRETEELDRLYRLKDACLDALQAAQNEIGCARSLYGVRRAELLAASAGWQVRVATIEELLKLAGIEPAKEVEVADQR